MDCKEALECFRSEARLARTLFAAEMPTEGVSALRTQALADLLIAQVLTQSGINLTQHHEQVSRLIVSYQGETKINTLCDALSRALDMLDPEDGDIPARIDQYAAEIDVTLFFQVDRTFRFLVDLLTGLYELKEKD